MYTLGRSHMYVRFSHFAPAPFCEGSTLAFVSEPNFCARSDLASSMGLSTRRASFTSFPPPSTKFMESLVESSALPPVLRALLSWSQLRRDGRCLHTSASCC